MKDTGRYSRGLRGAPESDSKESNISMTIDILETMGVFDSEFDLLGVSAVPGSSLLSALVLVSD